MPAAVGCYLVLIICWNVLTVIDGLFNLIEYRRDSRAAFANLRMAVGLSGKHHRHGRVSKFIEGTFFQGRGAFVPKSPPRLLSDFFHGFPSATFMASYCWSPHGDSELPRRVAQELLPEVAPLLPNKCWLDVEQLIPGTPSVPAMVSHGQTVGQ